MSTLGGPNIITDGLILYLDAANPKSYPGGTTSWYNLVTKDNNGTLVNGPTYSPINGGNIVLDGINDIIYVDYSGNTTNTYTFNIVFNTTGMTSSTSDRKSIFGLQYNNNYTYRQYNFELWGNSSRSYRGNGGPGSEGVDIANYLAISGNILPNSLNLITILLDSTSVTYYVNGIFNATRITNPLFVAEFNRIIIGSRISGSNIWAGNLYHFNIYDRLLSADEVLQNYKATKSRYKL